MCLKILDIFKWKTQNFWRIRLRQEIWERERKSDSVKIQRHPSNTSFTIRFKNHSHMLFLVPHCCSHMGRPQQGLQPQGRPQQQGNPQQAAPGRVRWRRPARPKRAAWREGLAATAPQAAAASPTGPSTNCPASRGWLTKSTC